MSTCPPHTATTLVSNDPSTAGSFAEPSRTTTFPAPVPVLSVAAVPSPRLLRAVLGVTSDRLFTACRNDVAE